MGVWVESIRFTSKGGALVNYKSDDILEFRPGSRGEITKFSENSRKKLAFYASNFAGAWKSMVTLTYARDYPTDGRVIKKDLNRFLSLIRKHLKYVKYLWFLEFQKRGAPHCHILLNFSYSVQLGRVLSESWSKTVIRGRDYDKKYINWVYWFNGESRKPKETTGTQFWQNAKSEGGLSHYAVKYASKMEQKEVPSRYRNVGRFWGCSRDLIDYVCEMYYGEFANQPIARDIFPDKPLSGLPKYIFGD